MTAATELPFHWEDEARPNLAAVPRKCSHPDRMRQYLETGDSACTSCGKTILADAAKRGRNNRKRGKDHEREWARRLGLRLTGPLQKADDALNDMFAGQCKSLASARFPSWLVRELDALRQAHPNRVPLVGLIEAAGTIRSRPPHRLVIVDEADWIALHVGPETTE